MITEMRCLALDDEPMALSVISSFCERIGGISLETYTDPVQGLERIRKSKPELIFLDVEIGDANGIQIARAVPKDCCIIFTTAHKQYAIDGYDIGVVDFLHKPFSFSRFEKAVTKAAGYIKYLQTKDRDNEIVVKEEYMNVSIPLSDIIYIEAMSNYCRIFRENDRCTTSRTSLKSLADGLPKKDFIRIHKSFIVSRRKIKRFTRKEVMLSTGRTLTVGRQYAEDALTSLRTDTAAVSSSDNM